MISHAITPTQMALHAAYKARQARQAQMTARVRSNDNARLRLIPPEPEFPLWQTSEITFRSHVDDYQIYMAKAASPKREWLIARAREFGLTVPVIRAKTRKVNIVFARQTMILEASEIWPDMSLKEIGRLFGDLDHSTVLHAIRRAKAYRDGSIQKPTPPKPKADVKSKGMFGPGKKIKPEKQDKIMEMFLEWRMTRMEIAEETGLAYKTIRQLIRRRTVKK